MVAVPGTPTTKEVTAASEATEQEPSHARRIRVTLSRFIGGGYVAFFFVCLPEIARDATIVASWWTPVALVLVFVPGWMLLGAKRPRFWDALGEVLPWTCGVSYLVAVALWFLAWNGEHGPVERSTWLVLFPGLASMALVVSRWPWTSLVHLVIASPTALLANGLGRADRFGHTYAVTEVLWSMAFSAVFVAGGIMAVRTGNVLDATQHESERLAGLAAARRAGDGLRTRFDMLVHDSVLAVLLNVGIGTPSRAVAAEARLIMRDVSELSDPPERIVDMDEFVSLIRAAIAELDPSAAVTMRVLPAGNHSINLSSRVIDAVSGATSEAIRNSRRHAGADATVTADIDIDSAGHVTVVVEDDGVGFDPTLLQPGRLGLSMSIRRRLLDVGGRAVVESTVGEGTRVTIEWPAP